MGGRKLMGVVVALVVLSLVPAGTFAQRAAAAVLSVPTAAAHCVDMWEHENGGGRKRYECGFNTLWVGSMGSDWNDTMSSISVGQNVSIKLYTESNFGGACRFIPGGTNYDTLRGIRIDWRKTWNDIVSSYVINPPSGC